MSVAEGPLGYVAYVPGWIAFAVFIISGRAARTCRNHDIFLPKE